MSICCQICPLSRLTRKTLGLVCRNSRTVAVIELGGASLSRSVSLRLSVSAPNLAVSPLAYGIARMYEQLIRSVPINVHVVANLASAAEVLGVPEETLHTDRLIDEHVGGRRSSIPSRKPESAGS